MMVHWSGHSCLFSFFLRFYLFVCLFIFRERRREREKHPCVVASHVPPAWDLARNPGMCPAWESNLFLQAGAQSTEQHQPGLGAVFIHGVGHLVESLGKFSWISSLIISSLFPVNFFLSTIMLLISKTLL